MLSDLWGWIVTQIQTNEIFAGIVGGSFLVSGLYMVRDVPRQIFELARRHFTTTLVTRSEDDGFVWINLWLSERSYVKRARRLKLEGVRRNGKWDWFTGIGYGTHVFFHAGALFVIQREEPKFSHNNRREVEVLRITTVGRAHKAINTMIGEAKRACEMADGISVHIHMRHYWASSSRVMRSIDTIVLPFEQKDRVLKDIRQFIDREDWYHAHGVPYRRGYMFSGPPGTGKTSFALALAGEFKRDLYVLNLGSLRSDDELIEAMSEVSSEAVLVLEDIDAVAAAVDRTDDGDRGEKSSISTSALLNTIDGAMAVEGRVLIMTSNHPDKIDPALLRPGRVDLHERIEPLSPAYVARMFALFFPEERALVNEIGGKLHQRLPAAVVQEACIAHLDNPDAAAKAILRACGPV